MRASVLALGCVGTIVAVAWFAGCGSNVETAGTAGAGGHGGSASTTGTVIGTGTTSNVTGTGGSDVSVVSSGPTTTVSATVSSSSGGPDPVCESACMHAASCGSDICTQYTINCQQTNAQIDCIAECISNIPCPINGGAALGCLQMCSGGSSSSTSSGFATSVSASSSSGMMGNSCQQCSLQHCGGSIGPCAGNQTCLGWLMCVQPCNQQTPPDPACFAACDTQYAGASALYDAIYACSCSKCTTECGSIPECTMGGSGDAGP